MSLKNEGMQVKEKKQKEMEKAEYGKGSKETVKRRREVDEEQKKMGFMSLIDLHCSESFISHKRTSFWPLGCAKTVFLLTSRAWVTVLRHSF